MYLLQIAFTLKEWGEEGFEASLALDAESLFQASCPFLGVQGLRTVGRVTAFLHDN